MLAATNNEIVAVGPTFLYLDGAMFRSPPASGTELYAVPAYSVIRSILVPLSAGLCLAVGIGAILSGVGLFRLPYSLEVLRIRQPWAFPVHMVTGGLGLMLAMAAIGLRQRATMHRAIGSMAMALLVTAALTAMPTALSSLAPKMAKIGFMAQGIATLVCLYCGTIAIRRGRLEQHCAWMQSAAAIAFGAVVLRLMLIAADGAGISPERAYSTSAWLCWLLPLVAVRLLVRMTGRSRQ